MFPFLLRYKSNARHSNLIDAFELEIQLVITCSKLTMQTLEQGVKYV